MFWMMNFAAEKFSDKERYYTKNKNSVSSSCYSVAELAYIPVLSRPWRVVTTTDEHGCEQYRG